MIQLVKQGNYKLTETLHSTKILSLDNEKNFAWIKAKKIGEILVTAKKPHKTDNILAVGKYRIYKVKDEDDFTDMLHLELSVGSGIWQGYFLPVGIPNGERRRRILPTEELITKTVY